MTIKKHKIYLFFAGAILILVGFYIGFLPADYLTQFFSRREFGLDSLSEMRGMGGALFILGLFVVGGACIKRIENTSLIISALIFGAFSAFRLLGILLDGIPSQSIFIALSIELVFAVMVIPLLLSQQSSVEK
jgi:hypothetical protein